MAICVSCTRPLLPYPQKFDRDEALTHLRTCVSMKQLKQIHTKIIRTGLHSDQVLVRKMIELCSSFRHSDYASLVFNQLSDPVTFTWNIMIRFYSLSERSLDALLLFNLMICQSVPPDKFTFPFVLKACADLLLIWKGKECHGMAIKCGLYNDMFLRNTLIDFYFKCGELSYARKVFEKMRVRNVVTGSVVVAGLVSLGKLNDARKVFEEMPERNVVTWSVMIDGYARNGFPQDAFELLRRMQIENAKPNEFTLVSLLRAATEMESLKLGCWIHDFALKNEFEIGVFLGTALIDMYSKCGSIDDAIQVFEMMQCKSIATWNTMITSLGVHGLAEEALDLFYQLEKTSLRPDTITFVAVLSACVNIHNFHEGYRFFKCMTEVYGLTPIQEHYDCMTELRRWDKVLRRRLWLEESDPVGEYGTESSQFVRPFGDPIWGEPGLKV